jgi:hypothetical protein
MGTSATAHINPGTGEELVTDGNPLARKLAAISAEVKRVGKSGYNEHFKYAFANENDLLDAVRGHFAAANIAIIPRAIPESLVITPGQGNRKDQIVTTMMVEFTIVDGDSGVREIGCYPGCGSDNLDKGPYKAVTGATKYFLQKLLLIPTGDDPEREHHHGAPSHPQGRPLGQAPAPAAAPATNQPRPLGQPAPTAAARPLGTAPAPAPQAAQATPAPAPTSGPRPLGAARPGVAQPAPAPVSAARPLGAPAPAPLPVQAPAAAAPVDPRPVVKLVDVVFVRAGEKPASKKPYGLWRVTTESGQKLAAFDDENGDIGAGLNKAWQDGFSVRLTIEDTQFGPRATAFEVVK